MLVRIIGTVIDNDTVQVVPNSGVKVSSWQIWTIDFPLIISQGLRIETPGANREVNDIVNSPTNLVFFPMVLAFRRTQAPYYIVGK